MYLGSLILLLINNIHCLHEICSYADSGLIVTDSIIRQSFNKLFSMLKLKKVRQKSRLKEYSTLHRYFVSLAIQDHKILKEIESITKISANNKNSTDLVTIIDEWLEEQIHLLKNKIEHNDDENIVTYIDNFLNNLDELKKENIVGKAYVDINSEVLNLLTINNDKPENDSSKYEEDESEDDILDENEFWEPSGRRIFKGERSKIKYFPFMATIQIFNNFHCAGSIIKSDLIITASSCLQLAWNNRFFRENPAFLSVRVGSTFYNSGGEVIPVLEIYFHPLYDPKTLRNNICILRLVKHLKFRRKSKKVKKIDIDRNESPLALNTPGITVVGWGAREHSPVVGNPWIYRISYAVLDVYPLWDCQDVYSREYVTTKNFCAGFISRGGGACNKDVGGPGIVDGKLMGVISFGSPVCGTPDTPTVFTKIGYYTDWIEQIMEQYVPVSKKRTTRKPHVDPYGFVQTTKPPPPTTFKIQPIDGKMSPIPISQIDSQLRNIDEKLFKDFLVTMFNSKEIEEYEDILKESNTNFNIVNNENKLVVTENLVHITEFEEFPKSYTKIDELLLEDENDQNTGYTLIDGGVSIPNTYNNEIANIIEDIDLEKIVEEELVGHNKKETFDTKSQNDSVLTLIYISDSEKKGNSKIKSDEYTKHDSDSNEGLSIPLDGFNDLTRTKDESEIHSESELYGLLSEVIGEEFRNININTL